MMTHDIRAESLIKGAILSRILQPGVSQGRSGAGTRGWDSVPTFLLQRDAILYFGAVLSSHVSHPLLLGIPTSILGYTPDIGVVCGGDWWSLLGEAAPEFRRA